MVRVVDNGMKKYIHESSYVIHSTYRNRRSHFETLKILEKNINRWCSPLLACSWAICDGLDTDLLFCLPCLWRFSKLSVSSSNQFCILLFFQSFVYTSTEGSVTAREIKVATLHPSKLFTVATRKRCFREKRTLSKCGFEISWLESIVVKASDT